MTDKLPEPYDVTPWHANSIDCVWCDEGTELEENHRHKFYVSRDGASSRTADDLCHTFLYDVAALTAYTVPEWAAALELESSQWCEDPDDSQALSDEANGPAEYALADAGLSVWWNDGYTIERIELESELEDEGTER